jgi:hypothetical protein
MRCAQVCGSAMPRTQSQPRNGTACADA